MPATAKIFMHGRSQAVRLPKEFRFEGKEVHVSRVGDKVILEPVAEKPFDPDRMTEIVQKAGQARMVALENRALRNDLSSGDAAMRRLMVVWLRCLAHSVSKSWRLAVESSTYDCSMVS